MPETNKTPDQINNFDSFWKRLVQMSLWYMEKARKNKKQTNFGSFLNNNRVKIYKNWHPSKSAQNKNRTLTCMQTKTSGIFINDYNLSRTTRKSVKINSTSASFLCNLCFFPSLTKPYKTIVKQFILLQHSCALHSGKFEIFLRGRTLPLQKIEKFYKSRTKLAFCQKTRSCRLTSW